MTTFLSFRIVPVAAAKGSNLASLSSSIAKHISQSDVLVNENLDSSLEHEL